MRYGLRLFIGWTVLLAGFKAKANEPGIAFTQNLGQWPYQVAYAATLDGGNLFFERGGFTYHFYDKETLRKRHNPKKGEVLASELKCHAFRMRFLEASGSTVITASDKRSDYNNYFIGNDPSKWVGGAGNYGNILYSGIYRGIDLDIHALKSAVKYNFIVHPGSDPRAIKMKYSGADSVYLDRGQLNIVTSVNRVIEQQPFAYQYILGKKVIVKTDFVLSGQTVSFSVADYNPNFDLIIDPILVFSSFSGSTADNFGMTATYDLAGNLYSGGMAYANGYPTTVGAYSEAFHGAVASGRSDVVVTKYKRDGTTLLYSTYLGGANGTETVHSLIVNNANELFLYGVTGSSDFPFSKTAFDTTFNGGTAVNFSQNGTNFTAGTDLYVARFSADGRNLLASTFVGGSLNDGVNASTQLNYNYGDIFRGEIMLDRYGNVYVTSTTVSSNFPTTAGTLQPGYKSGYEAVVFKMPDNLSSMIWSTYLGGFQNDAGYSIAVNDSLEVFVAGGTNSSDFPATAGSLNSTYQGGRSDGFVCRINKNATAIVNASFIGTSSYDQSFFVQLDKRGFVYLTGQTEGTTTYPVVGTVYSNPNSGQYITKLNKSLSSIVFSTIFGSGTAKVDLSPSAFLVDDCEALYFIGWGGNIVTSVPTTGMPLSPSPFQSTTDGFNFYLIVLEKDAAALNYATYFGGGVSHEHVDGGTSRLDKQGIVYQSVCAGCGGNDDFPTTAGAWSATNNSTNCNNGVFKFDFEKEIATASATTTELKGCAPFKVFFTNSSTGFTFYEWDFGGGDITSSELNPVRTFTAPGTYKVRLLVENPSSCNIRDTTYFFITVNPGPSADFDYLLKGCDRTVDFANTSVAPGSTITSFNWDFGNGSTSSAEGPSHTYSLPGKYDVRLIVTNGFGCKDTVISTLEFGGSVKVMSDTSVCAPGQVKLWATGGVSYQWSPASALTGATTSTPTAKVDSSSVFTVAISSSDPSGKSCLTTYTVRVNMAQTAFARAVADPDTVIRGESSRLNVGPGSYKSYFWQPFESLDNISIPNPVATPQNTTTYSVTVKDDAGCTNTKDVVVYVMDEPCSETSIFVPNAFTPNNDGENDLLMVRGNFLTEMYFAVYDRWGEKVFETSDITKGWDGIFRGKPADPAVFAWYLKGKCAGGREFFKKGNVTLIR